MIRDGVNIQYNGIGPLILTEKLSRYYTAAGIEM